MFITYLNYKQLVNFKILGQLMGKLAGRQPFVLAQGGKSSHTCLNTVKALWIFQVYCVYIGFKECIGFKDF